MRILGPDGLGFREGGRGAEESVEGQDHVAELGRNVTGVMDQGVVLIHKQYHFN